ncbi:MAG: hypothetical protein ACTSPN_02085 [Promethearchaeota archaeon]
MIFQSILMERILVVGVAQSWSIIYLSIFAYKLLKRAKNRSTITLSTFFLMMATAYLVAIFSILSINSFFGYAFYITSWYFLMLSHGFLILFSLLLLQIEENISFMKFFMFMVLYSVIVTYVYWIGIFYDGIQYDISTGWRPLFSLPFAIINWLYIIFFLVIPEFIIALKLLKIFKGVKIVIRIKLFLLSIFLEYLVMIILISYNTLPNYITYRPILAIIGPLLGMLAAYLMYRSFGKKID